MYIEDKSIEKFFTENVLNHRKTDGCVRDYFHLFEDNLLISKNDLTNLNQSIDFNFESHHSNRGHLENSYTYMRNDYDSIHYRYELVSFKVKFIPKIA